MARLFKQGDVVRLKSGGPKMTIENYYVHVGISSSSVSDHLVDCTWFDNNGVLQSRTFEQDSLKKEDDE
ncbi:YodC family protein [Draconibacterium sediminis]|uniref:YodC family protein n=1 Tax=Draconibacterium sediminis TaxID=1544798 RepID=UPI0005D43D64|nr:DUF2158 domain-containing protein [Draconibacterium sediminis]